MCLQMCDISVTRLRTAPTGFCGSHQMCLPTKTTQFSPDTCASLFHYKQVIQAVLVVSLSKITT